MCPGKQLTPATLVACPFSGHYTFPTDMPEKTYDHNQIELKWHERWKDEGLYKAEENSAKPKY